MRKFIRIIIPTLLTLLFGSATIAQAPRGTEKSPVLMPVFFLSNSLAPNNPLLYSLTIFAGDLDGNGVDEIIGDQSDPNPDKRNVHFYTVEAGNLKLASSILEKGIIFAGAVANIDGNSRKEVIYFAYVYEPKGLGDALVLIRQDPHGLRRSAFGVSVDGHVDAMSAGKFLDSTKTSLAMDVMWKGEDETIYDDLVFFTWNGKGFQVGPKVRLKYNIMGLVALDLNGDGRDELLVLGDEAMEKCYLEVYTHGPNQGMKQLSRYSLPLEGCLGDKLVLLRALKHPHLLLVRSSEIYEVKLPTEKVAQPALELRATMHMQNPTAAAGDIDGDGDQELLLVASRLQLGPPETGFFVYKFFPE